jgi:protein-disulfide isomerase
MRKPLFFWLVIALCLAALVASSVLLVDYVRPAPVFCAAEGGCGAVKRTIFAHPLGLPMPVFGIAGFLAIALLALATGRRARIAQAMVAVFAAIVAMGLIVVQAMMKAVCPYCMVADVSAVLLAGLCVFRALKTHDPPEGKLQTGAALTSIVGAIALPLALGFAKKPLPVDLPAVIAEEIHKTPRGKVTVVDFVDFECPFCRMTHAEFAPLIAERKDKVHVARKHVPLRMHPHAFDAARAACCAETAGKGEAYAEALFTTPPEELTPENCEKIAQQQGLDPQRFRDCMKDPATDARIKADSQSFRDAHGHGLPTIFIGTQKLEGAQDRETLRAALDQAIKEL